jgi:hypothetical protein
MDRHRRQRRSSRRVAGEFFMAKRGAKTESIASPRDSWHTLCFAVGRVSRQMLTKRIIPPPSSAGLRARIFFVVSGLASSPAICTSSAGRDGGKKPRQTPGMPAFLATITTPLPWHISSGRKPIQKPHGPGRRSRRHHGLGTAHPPFLATTGHVGSEPGDMGCGTTPSRRTMNGCLASAGRDSGEGVAPVFQRCLAPARASRRNRVSDSDSGRVSDRGGEWEPESSCEPFSGGVVVGDVALRR